MLLFTKEHAMSNIIVQELFVEDNLCFTVQ